MPIVREMVLLEDKRPSWIPPAAVSWPFGEAFSRRIPREEGAWDALWLVAKDFTCLGERLGGHSRSVKAEQY